METVHLELPAALLQAAQVEGDHASEDAARLLALELFREGKVSLGRAAELCGTPLATFMEFAAQHGAPPLRYEKSDLEDELRSIERLGA